MSNCGLIIRSLLLYTKCKSAISHGLAKNIDVTTLRISMFAGTDSRESPTDLTPDVEALALEEAIFDHSPSNSLHSNQELMESHSNQMTTSSIDLENRLLKNEVASLNQEMASLVQRAKGSQTGTKHIGGYNA